MVSYDSARGVLVGGAGRWDAGLLEVALAYKIQIDGVVRWYWCVKGARS